MLTFLIGLALAGDCSLRDGAYLLTVEPGDGVQTLFGHTALLVYDEQQAGYSPVYDWGRFDYEPFPSLAWAVLTMTKEYYLASKTVDEMVARYDREGRGVVAQRLDLSAEEADVLSKAVAEDLNGGGQFLYNWYEPNCTTMVRDHIDGAVGGDLRAQLQDPGASPAGEVLRHAGPHLPLWLGLQWGSGRVARAPVSRFDATFLPEQLHDELAGASRGGRPLVEDTCTLGAVPYPGVPNVGPSRVGWLGLVGLLWALLLAGSRRVGAAAAGAGAVGTGLVLGAWGSAALLVGSLGTFAPFWGHHNLFLASPLHLLLLVAGGWHLRRPEATGPMGMVAVCIASGLLGLGWSALGAFADGNLGLALATLLPLSGLAWAVSPRPEPGS